MHIDFILSDFKPVPEPRKQVTVKHGRPLVFTPSVDPVNAYKQAIQLTARAAYGGKPLESPLYVHLVFVFERPANDRHRPEHRYPRVAKPDSDNLAKAVLDALTGILYAKDEQVYRLLVEKLNGAKGEGPSTHLMLRSWSDVWG